MRFVANSITEHYEHIGELRGELRGEERGKELGEKRGKKLGELRNMVEVGKEQLCEFEALLAEGVLSKRAYTRLAQPWRAKIAAAEAELQALDLEQHAQSA